MKEKREEEEEDNQMEIPEEDDHDQEGDEREEQEKKEREGEDNEEEEEEEGEEGEEEEGVGVEDDDEEEEEDREIRQTRLSQLIKIKIEGDDIDREKRLEYLVAQSEIFSHFLSEGDEFNREEAKATQGSRTRLSEEAEDRKLMKIAQTKSRVTRLMSQPASIVGGTMRSYQVEGLNWLVRLHENGINGILADEMGLGLILCYYFLIVIGKTLQTISLIAYLAETHIHPGCHIVIVPKATVSNWEREFKRWCPTIRTIRLLGTKAERQQVCETQLQQGKFDVLISSYESCMIEKSRIKKIKWNYLIVDEVIFHNILYFLDSIS
jgi:SWI/SNF-related matrix-associated actin-dependent regulator of chromatin subfamily A member 5